MSTHPYFAVRVIVTHADGSTSQRDYIRGARHMGRSMFASWALGDMLRLVTDDAPTSPVNFEVFEVTWEQVRDAISEYN